MTYRFTFVACAFLILAGCARQPVSAGVDTAAAADAPTTTDAPLPSLVYPGTPPPTEATEPDTTAAGALSADDPHAPVPGPGTCHLGSRNGQPTPDPSCTPGALNPAVTQATIGQTICVSGWTKTVRPSTSVTGPLKRKIAVAYAIPPTGELDHLVSLELGGAPDDPRNLWVEPGSIPNPKDKVEGYLKREVCAGRMPLDAARAGIAGDWTQYIGAGGAG